MAYRLETRCVAERRGPASFVDYRRRTYRSSDKGVSLAVRPSIRPPFVLGRRTPPLRGSGTAKGAAVPTPDLRMLRVARELRGRYLLAIDLVGIVVASYLALAIRFDRLSGPVFVPAFPIVVGLLLAVRTVVNTRLGLYSRRWRFASVPDLERLIAAVSLGSLIALAIFYGASAAGNTTWPDGFPR